MLGLEDEWLATSEEDYVALAVRGAKDAAQLGQLRAGLRDKMLSSPLCDGPGFIKQLEETYQALWDRWKRESFS